MPANIKALKARIRSVDSTMHITKAMELVASSKIKKATARMEESRFYRRVMEEAFADLAKTDSPYSKTTDSDAPRLYIAIAGDRGLAGGYNNNVFKQVKAAYREGDMVLPIGRRAVEYFRHHGAVLYSEDYTSSEKLTSADCAAIGRSVTSAFDEGTIGAVYLVYTEFVNMLTQEARTKQLLPLVPDEGEGEETHTAGTVYEPDAETVLNALIPEYVGGITYCLAAMSFASELAARRQAMDTATKNASDMIDDLNLRYNRARQGAITQEITEIVAGASE
ncbi:MAG: ATP synthase F1 subunit gamma [Ruminococcaceae bacterium]|nr:ATP synthase F1 subunit gamma [Oscillospiraceae bacterium]